MTDAQKYWDDFYAKNEFSWGREPSDFLRFMMPRMQKGLCLEIAMGEGVNASYLASNGFKVKGFDISEVAVTRARELARAKGVEVDAQRADMDMFIMGIMEYDSIVMTSYRPAITRYYSEMIRALKQGGTLLVESSLVDDMKEIIPNDESYRNWYFRANEVIKNLPGLLILYYQEAEVDGRHVVQCLAKKPLDKDAVKYGLFDMSTKQKDGGTDVHKKLAEAFFKKS